MNSACGVFAEKRNGMAAASEAGSAAAGVFGPSVVGSMSASQTVLRSEIHQEGISLTSTRDDACLRVWCSEDLILWSAA